MKKLKCLLFNIYSTVKRFLYKTEEESEKKRVVAKTSTGPSDEELKEAELEARATTQAAAQLAAKPHDTKTDIEISDEAKLEAEEARGRLEDLLKKREEETK